MAGVDESAEHGHGPQTPEGALVSGTAGGQVPQGSTRVGHNGQTGRLEVSQQYLTSTKQSRLNLTAEAESSIHFLLIDLTISKIKIRHL